MLQILMMQYFLVRTSFLLDAANPTLPALCEMADCRLQIADCLPTSKAKKPLPELCSGLPSSHRAASTRTRLWSTGICFPVALQPNNPTQPHRPFFDRYYQMYGCSLPNYHRPLLAWPLPSLQRRVRLRPTAPCSPLHPDIPKHRATKNEMMVTGATAHLHIPTDATSTAPLNRDSARCRCPQSTSQLHRPLLLHPESSRTYPPYCERHAPKCTKCIPLQVHHSSIIYPYPPHLQ